MRPWLEIKRPSGCLLNGLRLTIRNWPCVLSAYVIVAAFGLLAGSPLTAKIAPAIAPRVTAGLTASLDPNRLSQPATGNLNPPHLKELIHRFGPVARSAAKNNRAGNTLGLTFLGFILLLFILAGTVPMYLVEGSPGFRLLLKNGRGYFWPLARALIFAAGVVVPLLAALAGLRALLLQNVSKIYLGRRVSLYSALTAGVVLLAALLLLLWSDLIGMYTVRNRMLGNPRVRQALLPAFRLLRRQLFRILPGFLLAGALGAGLLLGSLFFWKALILSNYVWFAYMAAQIGFFLLLTTRFWQRGMEAALVLRSEPSGAVVAVPSQLQREIQPGEPTLQDLVLKLREQPWAKPDSALLNPALFPEAVRLETPQPPGKTSQESLLAEHAKKIALLDALTEEAAPPTPANPSGANSAQDLGRAALWGF